MARKRRRRYGKRDAAGDAAECGCCLLDVFAVIAVLTGALLWRRHRR